MRRVLRDDGTVWLNLGDSYWGGKGQSGSRGSDFQENRHVKGASINRGYQTLGGEKQTKPTDGKHDTIKPKDLMMIPARVAIALQTDGWYLRSEIVWHKPNPMPESVTDRPTKSHEMIYLFAKSSSYYYDYKAILEPANFDGRKDTMMKGSDKYKSGFGDINAHVNTMHARGHERWSNKLAGTGYGGDGQALKGHSGNYDADGNLLSHTTEGGIPARNKRSVWKISTYSYRGAHFATLPQKLIEPCILAGSKQGDTVLDPFSGSGTTGAVAIAHHRNYIGIDLNPEYITLAHKRIIAAQPTLFPVGKVI